MAKKKGTPNRNSETASLPWGAVPHEQFPQERIREQRITEGKIFLSPEVARVEMQCAREDNILGRNLAAARERAGYTQEQVAEALSISVRSVKKYESGDTVPNAMQLRVLSILFGVSTDYLLGLVSNEASELLSYYDFATPTQRRKMLDLARKIQKGDEDFSAEWAARDKQEWIGGKEQRVREYLERLVEWWGIDEVRTWIESDNERKERFGHLI